MLDTEKITGKHLEPYLRVFDVQWGEINVEELPQMDFDPSVRDRFRLTPGDLLSMKVEVIRVAPPNLERRIGRECYFQIAADIDFARVMRRRTQQDSFFTLWRGIDCSVGVFSTAGGNAKARSNICLRRNSGSIVLPFPPMSRGTDWQSPHFSDQELGRFDALTAEAERAIELLQERRTALISAAVTGKIDVRGLAETEAL